MTDRIEALVEQAKALSAEEQVAYHRALEDDGGYPVIRRVGGVAIRRAAATAVASN